MLDEAIRKAVREGFFTPIPGRALWNCPILVPKRITGAVLDTCLPCLVALDALYLRQHPNTPWLYESGIRYQLEPMGQEQWLTIPYCLLRLSQGRGIDCEDAGCWRAAELQVRRNEPARAIWTHRPNPRTGKRVYHIKTQRADRRVEDPSVALGMGPEWARRFGPTHSITDGDLY